MSFTLYTFFLKELHVGAYFFTGGFPVTSAFRWIVPYRVSAPGVSGLSCVVALVFPWIGYFHPFALAISSFFEAPSDLRRSVGGPRGPAFPSALGAL